MRERRRSASAKRSGRVALARLKAVILSGARRAKEIAKRALVSVVAVCGESVKPRSFVHLVYLVLILTLIFFNKLFFYFTKWSSVILSIRTINKENLTAQI